MSFIDDCKKYFGTKDIYEIFNIERDCNEQQIKKSYRTLSLKYHPDRYHNEKEELINEVTKKFQIISKIHKLLSDDEKRKLYDETGLINNEDIIEGDDNADWLKYWRLLFPKVTVKDINSFMKKYINSDEQRDDIKREYLRFDGDMDKLFETIIGFDEIRTREIINEMIDADEIPAFDKFTNETDAKRKKRMRRAEKEAKEAKVAEEEMDTMNDLAMAIKNKNASHFDNMMANLEAKYCKPKSSSSKKKQKTK